jgi:hypothetical protein
MANHILQYYSFIARGSHNHNGDICTYTFKIKSRQVYVGIHPTFGEAGRWTTNKNRGMS